MSWHSEQDAQSHTRCAHPHTHFLADKNFDRTGIGVWQHARVQPLVR